MVQHDRPPWAVCVRMCGKAFRCRRRKPESSLECLSGDTSQSLIRGVLFQNPWLGTKMSTDSVQASLLKSSFEKHDGNVLYIEVNEMIGLVCHVGAKVSANHTVPGWRVPFVKLLFDEGGHVL